MVDDTSDTSGNVGFLKRENNKLKREIKRLLSQIELMENESCKRKKLEENVILQNNELQQNIELLQQTERKLEISQREKSSLLHKNQ